LLFEQIKGAGADSVIILHPHAPKEGLQIARRIGLNYVAVFPQTFTVCSNNWAYAPEKVFAASSAITMLCEGEGEGAVVEVCTLLRSGQDYSKVKNLSIKKDGKIIQNKPGKNFDLDELEHVHWDLLDKKIMRKPETFEFPIHTSRGCPHRCTFCVNVVTQNFWRSRSPEKVVQDLEGIRNLGVNEIRFSSIGIKRPLLYIKWCSLSNYYIKKKMV